MAAKNELITSLNKTKTAIMYFSIYRYLAHIPKFRTYYTGELFTLLSENLLKAVYNVFTHSLLRKFFFFICTHAHTLLQFFSTKGARISSSFTLNHASS